MWASVPVETARKISPQTGFDSQYFNPVAICWTNYIIPVDIPIRAIPKTGKTLEFPENWFSDDHNVWTEFLYAKAALTFIL